MRMDRDLRSLKNSIQTCGKRAGEEADVFADSGAEMGTKNEVELGADVAK